MKVVKIGVDGKYELVDFVPNNMKKPVACSSIYRNNMLMIYDYGNEDGEINEMATENLYFYKNHCYYDEETYKNTVKIHGDAYIFNFNANTLTVEDCGKGEIHAMDDAYVADFEYSKFYIGLPEPEEVMDDEDFIKW